MRTLTQWTDKIPDADNTGLKIPVYDMCYRPDGMQLVATVGNRVIVYDAAAGDLVHSCKGHKDTVYCVSYCLDGKRFASGGADRTVIIWSSKGDGILKYQHNDSIQAVAYNPITHQLASVTTTDFGLWSQAQEQKNVGKHKLAAKALCCAWTFDGQLLAIGLFNGHVTIRGRSGEEKYTIRRNAPVWSLCWNPVREDTIEILAIGTWDKKLSFYEAKGTQIGKDKDLGFDPCSVSYFTNGDYLLISGSHGKVGLYTKDGTFLVTLTEGSDWIWTAKQRPKQFSITQGSNDGFVTSSSLLFATVHSIYQEMYVFRDMMTDVVVHQLTLDRKLRIPCKDYVKKCAIYRERLAVQLSERIIIYELYYDESYELRFRVRERINKKLECSLLCVTANNLILCMDRKLTCFDFYGNKRREWMMESIIRYIKVVGGLSEREALLIGLKNGAVMKIFVDNAFPVQLVKLTVPIRCLDLSASRRKLAVVDENAFCQVYNLKSKELLFQESNANAVSWNSDYEDMLCFSGNGVLNIKTGNLASYQQKLQGFVVGFKANKVFCLHFSSMSSIDVPHSHALYKYIEKREFDNAYKIACLGVTESDWKMLGMHAMSNLALEIARKSFIRIREVNFVELLNRIELERRSSGSNEASLLGDILAFQGKYHEAAKCFVKAGLDSRAIEMFCDMKMWDEARAVCSNEEHVKELIRRQAKWSEDMGEQQEACKMYLAAGDFHRAIRLLGESGDIPKLIEVCRTLPKSDTAAVAECGAIFRRHNEMNYAVEAYQRIGDTRALLHIYIDMNRWEDAFKIVDKFPQYASDVYVPYAGWLATNDKFEEAWEALKKAQHPEEAIRMMEQLAANCVFTRKFHDAAFYLFKLALETGNTEKGQVVTEDLVNKKLAKYHQFRRKAEIYYVYSFIYKFNTQPFTSMDTVALFNACKYLLGCLGENEVAPYNVAKLDVLLALGKLTTDLEMFRIARTIHDKLQQYVLPPAVQEKIDIHTLIVRGRPYQDKEELLPMCYRCGHINTALSSSGDRCTQCMHVFVRSFHSFEVLPLVEFVLGDDITDDAFEAAIMRSGSGSSAAQKQVQQQQHQQQQQSQGGADVMTMEDELVDMAMGAHSPGGGAGGSAGASAANADPFARQLMALELQGKAKHYTPYVFSFDMLSGDSFRRDRVYISRRSCGVLKMRNRYYRNVVPKRGVHLCGGCQNFFHVEDYEYEALRHGGCPFCRFKGYTNQGKNDDSMMPMSPMKA